MPAAVMRRKVARLSHGMGIFVFCGIIVDAEVPVSCCFMATVAAVGFQLMLRLTLFPVDFYNAGADGFL